MLVVGQIITMDPARPHADALASVAGRVVAVGSRSECTSALPPAAVVHHAPGTVVPGLIDSHLHLQRAGLKLLRHAAARGASPQEALALLDGNAPSPPSPDAEPSFEERLEALRAIQPILHAAGITGVVDPAVVPAELGAYIECQRRGELSTRVVAMPH